MRMRKIDDEKCQEMLQEGKSQREMARFFGVSDAAVSKRFKRLTPAEPTEPLKIDALTPKERAFVVAVASGESQTSAALKAFDCGSYQSGKALGHTLMGNEGIKDALAEIRDREIPIDHLVKRLRQHVDSRDPATSLRAVDMGLKLHGAYPEGKKAGEGGEHKTFIDLSRYEIHVHGNPSPCAGGDKGYNPMPETERSKRDAANSICSE